jgi:hypothetical protein
MHHWSVVYDKYIRESNWLQYYYSRIFRRVWILNWNSVLFLIVFLSMTGLSLRRPISAGTYCILSIMVCWHSLLVAALRLDCPFHLPQFCISLPDVYTFVLFHCMEQSPWKPGSHIITGFRQYQMKNTLLTYSSFLKVSDRSGGIRCSWL